MRSLFTQQKLAAFAVVFVLAHGLSITLGLPSALLWSYPFLIAAPCAAGAVCIFRAIQSPPRIRMAWTMFAEACLMWAFAMCTSFLEYAAHGNLQTVPELSDFLFFASNIPLLLLLLIPMEGERSTLFTVMDTLQAVCAACLIYLLLFHTLPFLGTAIPTTGIQHVIRTENIANFLLAAASVVRFVISSRSGPRRQLFLTTCVFLWTYAAIAAVNNALTLVLGDRTGYLDLLGPVPFLIVAIFAVRAPASCNEPQPKQVRSTMVLTLDGASHIVFTLVLLMLGGMSVRQHYRLGMVAILLSLAGYAVRSILLQNRYLRSQRMLQEARDRLEALAQEDSLTGVANRRCFDTTLKREWEAALRSGASLSLLLIDIDYFKLLNDRQGHQAGDECLIRVAHALRAMLPRKHDLLARYGGEEFAVVLPATDAEGARRVAEILVRGIAALAIQNPSPTGPRLTISIGVANCDSAFTSTPARLIKNADHGLYAAKVEGRNRVVTAPPDFLEAAPASAEALA